jgi:hypothetical protein
MVEMIRRLTSLLAAIALIFAVAAPPAAACESAAAEGGAAPSAMSGSTHSMDDITQADCPESGTPANPEHDSDCMATCLSMIGCSSPCFVVEGALVGSTGDESPAPQTATTLHPTRYSAPDRPPPRL